MFDSAVIHMNDKYKSWGKAIPFFPTADLVAIKTKCIKDQQCYFKALSSGYYQCKVMGKNVEHAG